MKGVSVTTVTASLAANHFHNVKDTRRHRLRRPAQHTRAATERTVSAELYWRHRVSLPMAKNAYPHATPFDALDDAEGCCLPQEVKRRRSNMPGTLKANGVVKTLLQMDGIFGAHGSADLSWKAPAPP